VSKVPTAVTSTPVNREIAAPGEAFLDQLGRHPELAGLGIAVTQIVKLVDRSESAIPELKKAIMAEPFIAQKLLRAANVAIARCGTASVTTLSKAIVVLGLEQVRTLALSTLLLSKLKNKRQATQLEAEFATLLLRLDTGAGDRPRTQSLRARRSGTLCPVSLFWPISRWPVPL